MYYFASLPPMVNSEREQFSSVSGHNYAERDVKPNYPLPLPFNAITYKSLSHW